VPVLAASEPIRRSAAPTTDTAELQERQVPDVSSRPDRQFL
jgi:hypothetical protein